MNSILCSVLIGCFLVFLLPRTNALVIDSATQNELNKRLHVQGAMGGNITLTSNSSLGSGTFSFVLSGECSDGTPVAIKATSIKDLLSYTQEYECYEQLNATTDKVCEKYGIPFIYHSGDFLEYKTMAMTMLDSSLFSLEDRIGSFSKDTILIIFRDMIKTLKFVHSKGITHKDIFQGNIMTKGANVFLMDFNRCTTQKLLNLPVPNGDAAVYYDMVTLFTNAVANLRTITVREIILKSNLEINEKKRQIKEELLLEKLKYSELVEPFAEYCFEIIDAKHEQRSPKYDDLYKIFDDLLYTGRNRSERIVFEWLTPAEKAAAMVESILPIESIVFSDQNAN